MPYVKKENQTNTTGHIEQYTMSTQGHGLKLVFGKLVLTNSFFNVYILC